MRQSLNLMAGAPVALRAAQAVTLAQVAGQVVVVPVDSAFDGSRTVSKRADRPTATVTLTKDQAQEFKLSGKYRARLTLNPSPEGSRAAFVLMADPNGSIVVYDKA